MSKQIKQELTRTPTILGKRRPDTEPDESDSESSRSDLGSEIATELDMLTAMDPIPINLPVTPVTVPAVPLDWDPENSRTYRNWKIDMTSFLSDPVILPWEEKFRRACVEIRQRCAPTPENDALLAEKCPLVVNQYGPHRWLERSRITKARAIEEARTEAAKTILHRHMLG